MHLKIDSGYMKKKIKEVNIRQFNNRWRFNTPTLIMDRKAKQTTKKINK